MRPIADLRFVANWAASKVRHRGLSQEWGALITQSQLEPNVKVYGGARVSKSSLGAYTYVAKNSLVFHTTIGRFCSIGPNCQLGLGKHPSRGFVSTHPAFYSTTRECGVTFADQDYFERYEPITVGHDVWIGANVLVRDGVQIGTGAIVGAGAVVTKSVPPYAVVGGVPARVLRHRFDEPTIGRLLESRWWDRDPEWLRENFRSFHDLPRFLEAIGSSR